MKIKQRRRENRTQMDGLLNVEVDDKNRKRGRWKDEVGLEEPFEKYWEKFISIMSELHSRLDDSLAQISVAKDRTDLTPNDARPVHCVPHRTKVDAREIKRTKTEKMMVMNFNEHTRQNGQC